MHTTLPDTTPFWLAERRAVKYAPLSRDHRVDVVVVGGGITGVTAAYLLKQAGKSVALVERSRAGESETGHTTAHLTAVTDRRLTDLVDAFGVDHAQAVWDAGLAAIAQIHNIVTTEQIDCDFKWVPAWLFSPPEEDREKGQAAMVHEAELAIELGFDATYVEGAPVFDRPGVRYEDQARFHPTRYLSALVQQIPGENCFVFEDSEVTEVSDDPLQVHVGRHKVTADFLIMATHVPLRLGIGALRATMLQTDLFQYSTYAIHGRAPKGAAPEGLYWDTTPGAYDYLRVDTCRGYDDVIFGGEDHKTGQSDDTLRSFAALESRLAKILPSVKVMHRWSGQVIETRDGLPYIGEASPRRFAATGYAGNGMTFGTLAGMMAADAATGRANPWRKLFDVGRTHLLMGAWNYIKENKDYPYYLIRDRFAGAEGRSLRAVRRDHGKILDLDGRRVAVYRDAHGNVTQLSPVCTHMGCQVDWNEAEKTWDCPCHGSRFTPQGRVMAGPAETHLARVDAPPDGSDY